MPDYQALLVDYGGVLTTPLQETMQGFCESDGIAYEDFLEQMAGLLGDHEADVNPVHALERGEIEVPHFEEVVAQRLRTRDGAPVPAAGLLARMFAGFRHDHRMLEALRRARRHGILTALVSNSWGLDYPREMWDGLFDAVVISGEVGMRKPDPDIYLFAARQLGVEPQRCVFVDDLPGNVRGAAAVGMCGVRHEDPETTLTELTAIFGVTLG